MIPPRLLALLLAVLLSWAPRVALADSHAGGAGAEAPQGRPETAPSDLQRAVADRVAGIEPADADAATARGQRLLERVAREYARQPVPPRGLSLPEAVGDATVKHLDAVLAGSRALAGQRGAGPVTAEDVTVALQNVTPHRVADGAVTFFPSLAEGQQILVPAADLESFRGTGVEWRMLAVALDDAAPTGDIDPAAAEVLASAVARHTLLLLRLAGQSLARLEDAPFLLGSHVHLATRDVHALATLDAKTSGASAAPGTPARSAADRASSAHDPSAVAAWYAAWELSREDPDALQQYAAQLGGIGRTDEAIAVYEEALRIRPDYDAALWGLALVYRSQGDAERTKEYIAPILGSGSDLEARAHFMLGTLASLANERDEALAHYEKAVALDPSLPEARMNLGLAYMGRGRGDEALVQFEEALRLKPDALMAHMFRAKILDNKGDEEAAVTELEMMLAIDPQHPRALFNLGQIQERHGRVAAAMEYYRRAEKSATQRGDARLAGQIARAIGAP